MPVRHLICRRVRNSAFVSGLLILLIVTLLPALAMAQAYDVLILLSRRDVISDEVLKGFRFEQKSSLRMLVLEDYSEVDVARIVREERPKAILTVGDSALNEVRKIKNTPVVAVMALGIHGRNAAQPNLTGVGLFVPPKQYIDMFKTMKKSRIGVIYNPDKSGWYLDSARRAAAEAGIELVTREVSGPRESINHLYALAGKVDALWMIPDGIAVTRNTAEAYFVFGQSHAVPVVSFAPNYLGFGAAAVLELDRIAIGRQADALITELLNGKSVRNMPVAFPKGATAKTNSAILQRLNLPPL